MNYPTNVWYLVVCVQFGFHFLSIFIYSSTLFCFYYVSIEKFSQEDETYFGEF